MDPNKGMYDVYHIREWEDKGEKKSKWMAAGVGFRNQDNSINLLLDLLPADGRLHIRERNGNNNKYNNKKQKGEQS